MHHVPILPEFLHVEDAIGWGFLEARLVCVLYMALQPYLRTGICRPAGFAASGATTTAGDAFERTQRNQTVSRRTGQAQFLFPKLIEPL